MTVRWERSMLAFLDDLEQQAEGLHLVERDLEVADRSHTEYARVSLASRVHAAAGRRVRVTLLGGLNLHGVVERTGVDWLLLVEPTGQEWLVRHAALAVVRGVTGRAVPDEALGVVRRLPLRSVLRRLADADTGCLFHLLDGTRAEGRILRLGADFAEVRLEGASDPASYDVVPLTSLAAVQTRG
jgi:hypothetical protein